MANLLDSGDNGGSSRGFGRSSEWATAGAQALRGGRRTRKKRGGWQTPEKLESISRFSPIRRIERKRRKTIQKSIKRIKEKDAERSKQKEKVEKEINLGKY